MYELRDYLNAINFTKENLLDTDDQTWEKKYPPFVINKCLSVHYDCIAQANEMNGYHFLDKRTQFHFYINSIRKKKRFGGKWLSQAKLKNLEYVKEYYGYSNEKAKDALNILTEEQIELIKISLLKGGRTKMSEEAINWSADSMLEVTIKQPDDFLKIRETLTRIGVASRKDKTLFQSCHILHKQGKYFITHFKELFALDGKKATLTQNDIQRRNTISILLQDWNLIDIVDKAKSEDKAPLSQIKVLPFKEKKEWNLSAKYNIGKKVEAKDNTDNASTEV